MRSRLDMDVLPYALGAILLGMVTLVVRDFALTWQPVPEGVPARAALAMVSGAVLVAGALAAPWRKAGAAGLILPLFYALWVVALHVPNFLKTPSVGTLLGVAEILSLAAAGTVLAPARLSPRWLRPMARILYGLCPLVFGLSHFVYAQAASAMVPAWIPSPLVWTYFTGTAHVAAGMAILSGVLAQLAVRLLALMTLSFVLLIHIPGVVAAPGDRGQWTMLGAATAIAGAAWLARRLVAERRSSALEPTLRAA